MGRMYEAYFDLKFLLNRGYRKSSALEFIANHYRLTLRERHFLARCVFPDSWVREVRKKILRDLSGLRVGVDGFNVLITLESLLQGIAVICEDGLVRDLKYQGKYRFSDLTEKVIDIMIKTLASASPGEVFVFYGRSISKSGEIRKITLRIMKNYGLRGEVELVKSPDYELKNFEYVATADTGIIEKVKGVYDIVANSARMLGIKPLGFSEALKIFDERLK
ncbi:DUF434 domain-containing protein [Pyrococcus sp. ST04]|uniref:DUF434 domain-containing protein n=1 Tax=Pyrococcus sp. ST04 TaxID=1183377 RepID=UPI0002605E8F|nr:DUF434 domain-containing protein [Pyrococcus sp. ST04]AFK23216.1 hypothetical protein Py04_1646 [Pyrococcus sp. ST04]